MPTVRRIFLPLREEARKMKDQVVMEMMNERVRKVRSSPATRFLSCRTSNHTAHEPHCDAIELFDHTDVIANARARPVVQRLGDGKSRLLRGLNIVSTVEDISAETQPSTLLARTASFH